jgi:beta-mannosidase
MVVQSLTDKWRFRQQGTDEWLPATVPGCVHTDLLAIGKIPDPFIGKNELDVKWVAAKDWEYSRVFTLDGPILSADRVFLVCKGIDTIADVILNGNLIGHTENMFRTYQWDVKSSLFPGKNLISILFYSPMKFIQSKQAERPLPKGVNEGSASIRKVQSHFGWDWGPTLPTVGIWQEIFLEGQSTARIEEIRFSQFHTADQVRLTINSTIEQWIKEALTLDVSIHTPDGKLINRQISIHGAENALQMDIQSPQLWWPNGLGKQPLYKVEIKLRNSANVLDSREYQIGLHKIELRQEADAWGKTFTFVVNDVPIFAKGADWIPADSFITRLTHSQLEHLISSCAQANMNMLRVWGGGFYESEDFYDLCDRYGILVWQDCGFACAPYPLDEPDFVANVNSEIRENIRRLRHHASLALWCGNNEIEMMWALWKKEKSLTQAYEQYFHHTLPQLVKEEDPDHAYWPSSPSSNKFRVHTNSDAIGDTHLWHVWHGLEPFTYFRSRFTRFCSEFGLESLPAMPTIASFAKPEDYSLKSAVFLHHQRSAGGNDKMLYYLTTRFRIPRDFADMVYLTQIMQAECVRIAVEHWRRNRPGCSGALYWQLNDCWPVSSWSSIDYYGRWKALQYFARRFNAPLALSIEENGTHVVLHIVNDTQQIFTGMVFYSLETFTGKVLRSGSQAITVPINSNTVFELPVLESEIKRSGRKKVALVVELLRNDEKLSTQVLLFAPEKLIQLPNPDLVVTPRIEGDAVIFSVSARNLARYVEVGLTGADVEFSDNFFDLPAGNTAEILCPIPEGWTLDRVKNSLTCRSVFDVAPAGNLFSDQLEHIRTSLTWVSIQTRVLFKFME